MIVQITEVLKTCLDHRFSVGDIIEVKKHARGATDRYTIVKDIKIKLRTVLESYPLSNWYILKSSCKLYCILTDRLKELKDA